MQNEAMVTDIRSLISEADMDTAFEKTRQWLIAGGRDEALLQLDLIESEHNDVQKTSCTKTSHTRQTLKKPFPDYSGNGFRLVKPS
jgi:hypothetical protein